MSPDEQLDEQLSRLIDGDLPDDEAESLRARITSDPAVAAAHASLMALHDALGELPEEATPPPLARGILPKRARRFHPALPWGLALAAMLFAFLRAPQPTEILLVSGENVVSGDLKLLAGDVRISLDGRARIFVEPPPGLVRVADQNPPEDTMQTRTLLSALAGAVVTVTVYEGSAVVNAANTEPVVVAAGHERAFGEPTPPVALPQPGTPERAEALRQRLEALDAELESTRKELQTERFAGALVRGQLQAEQGVTSEWPPAGKVPESMTPDGFEASLAAQLEGLEGYAVSHVDCSEYPCVGAIRYTGESESDDWNTAVGERVEEWVGGELGEDHSLSTNTSRYRHDGHDARFVMFGAHTGDDEVGTRTKWRIDQLVEQVGVEMAEEADVVEQ